MNFWERRAEQSKRETEGITVRIDAYPGLAFRLRRLCDWNVEYLRAQVAIASLPDVKAYLERARAPGYVQTDEDAAIDRRISLETFAAGCLTGWEGVPQLPGGKGKFLPFSIPNAITLLERFPDIYVALRREASAPANFVPADVADLIAGN